MIDLHTHSTASDGTITPSGIVKMAADMGLKGIALTDHDTIDGLEEFQAAGNLHPELLCIPGIELSCHIEGERHNYHIVGLFIDLEHCEPLRELCRQCIIWRNERNQNMLEKLNELGMSLTMDEVQAIKIDGEGVTGRPHFAQALVAKGYCKSRQEAFDTLINPGHPAFVERHVPDPQTCFEALHRSGALAIWAHPMSRKCMTNIHCENLLQQLCPLGLDGMEIYYPEHTSIQRQTLHSLALKYRLLVSGGSDFHGANQTSQLGTGHGDLFVPDSLLNALTEAKHHN